MRDGAPHLAVAAPPADLRRGARLNFPESYEGKTAEQGERAAEEETRGALVALAEHFAAARSRPARTPLCLAPPPFHPLARTRRDARPRRAARLQGGRWPWSCWAPPRSPSWRRHATRPRAPGRSPSRRRRRRRWLCPGSGASGAAAAATPPSIHHASARCRAAGAGRRAATAASPPRRVTTTRRRRRRRRTTRRRSLGTERMRRSAAGLRASGGGTRRAARGRRRAASRRRATRRAGTRRSRGRWSCWSWGATTRG